MALTKKTPVRGRSAKAAKAKASRADAKKKTKVKAASKGRASSSKAKRTLSKAKRSSSSTSAAGGSSSRAKPGTVAHQSSFARRNWAKRLVFKGKKVKTSTGLFKRDLMRNARGTVVSKRKSAIGRQRYYENNLDLWIRSLMETRSEQGIKGFVLCKKAGISAERKLYSGTRSTWEDMVASRMMSNMQRRPEIMGKISKMLQETTPRSERGASGGGGAGTTASSSSSSSKVKTEGADGLSIVPGDAVRVQRNAANFEYRGQTGVVERFQLGRVVVNFQGTLKAVKLEDLTKV